MLATRALRSFATAMTGQPLTLSPRLLRRTTQGILNDIDLIVYDMAGTTVEEGGQVYETLRKVMNDDGLKVSEEDMHPWHGAKKEAVIEHFALDQGTKPEEVEERVNKIADAFLDGVTEAYFSESSKVRHITPELPIYLRSLRAAGVKVALDTGYPANIQGALVQRLGFDDTEVVDAYISAYEVPEGRPYPYMVHRLMERTGIMDVRRVCKVGDSCRDMEEGRNAGCGLVVGVTSGADTAEDLLASGADLIAEYVTDLPVPNKSRPAADLTLPDLS